jgi:hypothetical protein
MRLPVRLSDLLILFTAVDVLVLYLALSAAGRGVLVLPVLVVAVVLTRAYTAAASDRLRLLALLALVAVLFMLPQALLILSRPPHAPIQDGLLITEAAARRLLAGLDPYGHGYLDSAPLRAFYAPEFPINPLLGHYVYPPGAILLATPFQALGVDLAWLWVPVILALALAAHAAAGRAGVVAVALNPLLLFDYLYLFNDLLFLAATLAGVGLLARRRFIAGGTALGVALLLKQQAILFIPFAALLAGRRGWLPALAAGAATVLLVSLPFLLWSPGAFLGDTAAYFYGSGLASFPIRGLGLPGMLVSLGVIPSRWAAYPAGILQVLVALPLLGLALVRLHRHFTWPAFWAWLGAFSVAVFLLGRTLAPNYVTLIGLLLTLAIASGLEDPVPGAAVAGRLDHPAGEPGV